MGLLDASATRSSEPDVSIVQDAVEVERRTGLFSPIWRVYDFVAAAAWVPTSMNALEVAERRLFQGVKSFIQSRFVPVWSGRYQVWTVAINAPPTPGLQVYQRPQGPTTTSHVDKVPLVLLHGFGGGVGLWAQSFDVLAKDRAVYAFDLLGFGRSSRPRFSRDPTLAETEWVRSIEEWRQEMQLDKMILFGHSLGGYLASAYAIEHPERVRHLVLAEPWGFLPKPAPNDRQYTLPVWVRTLAHIVSLFNPLSTLRAVGPWGPSLVRRIRGDLGRKYGNGDEEAIFDYIYHCNAQEPSGETAFKTMSASFGWAKRPMIDRLPQGLDKDVPVTFVFGSRSWMDSGAGYEMQQHLRPDSYVGVHVVAGAGHHVYADEPDQFNVIMTDVCRVVDNNVDGVDDRNDF